MPARSARAPLARLSFVATKRTGRTGLHRGGVGVLFAAALITTGLIATGCAAGRHSQTAYQRPTLDGTEATVGSIALRGMTIEPPAASTFYAKGTSAPVRLVIVNSGESADQLTGITSPSISGWRVFPTASAAQGVLDPTGTPTSSAVSPSSGAASATSAGSQPVNLPAGARVSWGTPEGKAVLVLTSLRKPAYPGSSIPITFSFAKAGNVTVRVPVGLTNGMNDSVIPSATGGSE